VAGRFPSRTLGEDLCRSLVGARQELGNDRHTLIHVMLSRSRRSELPTEQARYNLSEHLAKLALGRNAAVGNYPKTSAE
jgi:hypothetical protein